MSGHVVLVGAGPGDEGLITVKGLKAIESADVIIYDYLANPKLLKHAKKECEFIYVGKKAKNHTLSQDGINELIVDKASEGKKVLRLKGGDPYIFGRGGEEGAYLFSKGIDFEVVPGISSSIGGLAYAGIPVTYREIATSFHVITGHTSEETKPINYEALAKLDGTLIFLMGIGNMDKITSGLIRAGKSAHTPAAIVYEASTPRQKVEVATLETLVSKKHVGEEKPGIIVVGEVVTKRTALDFVSRKPLFGKKIIITRATTQNSSLMEKVTELGGFAVELPTIQIDPIRSTELQESIEHIKDYNHIIFTSQNSVQIFLDQLRKRNLDARCLSNLKITCIGTVTAKMLETYYLRPDYVAETYSGEGICSLLEDVLKKSDKVLFPRSKKGNQKIVDVLSDLCELTVIDIYDTVLVEQEIDVVKDALKDTDWILFTSGSTVDNFIQLLNSAEIIWDEKIKNLSIGPVTSQRLFYHQCQNVIESKTHTIDGMIQRMIEYYA